jgi:hypothetical protein
MTEILLDIFFWTVEEMNKLIGERYRYHTCENHKKHTESLDRVQCFSMFKQVVRIATIGLLRVKF